MPCGDSSGPWLSTLALGPTLAQTPSGSSGASKLYSRRGRIPFLGLAPSVPSDCRGRGPTLLSSVAVLLRCGGADILDPRAMRLLQLSAPLSALARVVGGFTSPPRPCPPPPVNPSSSVSTPGV